MIWNKKIGKNKSKADYGKLWCAQCGRFWPWSQRHNNKTICVPLSNKADPPDWVMLLDHFPTTNQANPANVTISSQQVRRRLVGKQTAFTRDSESAPSASGASASSSSVLPRVGVHVCSEWDGGMPLCSNKPRLLLGPSRLEVARMMQFHA